MEPLTWTGAIGPYLNPVFLIVAALVLAAFVLQFLMALVGFRAGALVPVGDGTLARTPTPLDRVNQGLGFGVWALGAVVVLYFAAGFLMQGQSKGILGWMITRLWPVWLALAVTLALSMRFRRRLGLYGKLMDSPIGVTGFALVMFWVFTALFADIIATHDPLTVISGLKNKPPGVPMPDGTFWYILGGDALARDVFSRAVLGARDVLAIAPAATLFAFMVGITLGLPAGYLSGPAVGRGSLAMFVGAGLAVGLLVGAVVLGAGPRDLVMLAVALVAVAALVTQLELDTLLSFLSNLVLAFPVILLFYLLVTPEIVETGIPVYLAAVLFLFPVIFLCVLFNSRFHTQAPKRNLYVGVTLILGLWLYAGLAFDADPLGLISMPSNILIVFVSVVFVNSPTVFRIVRGLTLDIKTRDYVAAAQTRGEGPWYIMLWEILPNARGPLIVDFCLRIGYTTILLGTLGFFGLGVSPESPDWGSTINAGRTLLSIAPHPAVVPALALMSLVLGLNLLADGLREESLKD